VVLKEDRTIAELCEMEVKSDKKDRVKGKME
jgi:hypothetical protein